MAGVLRVKFTRHAVEKFEVVKSYGFVIRKELVIETVLDPEHLEKKGDQYFGLRAWMRNTL